MVRRSARRRGVLLGAVGVALVSLVVASAAPSAMAAPRAPSSAEAVAWSPCEPAGGELQCARVSVPLDWDHPEGRTIELAVIRHPASRPHARIGTLFVNPGGPGSSGVDFVRAAADVADAWGDGRFDVVSWDPRGTNASTPVRCFTSDAARDQFWAGATIPTTRTQSKAYQRRTVELARRCGEVSGDLLDHVSTADTARDLDALRRMVGDDRLTYVGLSYGTMIGQTYANLFPGRVRAMVLDGLVDVVRSTASAEARTASQSDSVDAVFAEFQALCEQAGPAHCALAGHGESVTQRVARVFATARAASIAAPHADPPGVLDAADLLLASYNPLRIAEDWPVFAADLNAAADGDASALEQTARGLRTPAAFQGATTSVAVSCLDGPARRPSQAWPSVIPALAGESTLYGSLLGWWLWAPCASGWPGHSSDRYAGPWGTPTPNPILLLNNRWDPATGYANAVVAQQRLGNAVLLTEDGHAHLTINDPSRCVDQARSRYLVDIVTPPRGTVCPPDRLPFA